MCWYLDTFIWITVSGSHIQEVNTLFCTERYVSNKMSVGKDYVVYIYTILVARRWPPTVNRAALYAFFPGCQYCFGYGGSKQMLHIVII